MIEVVAAFLVSLVLNILAAIIADKIRDKKKDREEQNKARRGRSRLAIILSKLRRFEKMDIKFISVLVVRDEA